MDGEELKRILDEYVTLRTRKRVTADGRSTKVASDSRWRNNQWVCSFCMSLSVTRDILLSQKGL
jgi:hypothetical protein